MSRNNAPRVLGSGKLKHVVTTSTLNNPRVHLFLLLVLVLPLYVLNARWGVEGNPDALAVAIPAYQVVDQGTLDLSDIGPVVDHMGRLDRWFVETSDGAIVSNRAPGLIALAIPAYALSDQESFTNGPATAVALLTTVLSVVVIWDVLIGLIGLRPATVGAITLAIGTTSWWVSSSELWPHGPGQLWAALAIVGLSRSAHASSGLAFAASVMTRPLTALFAFFAGLSESWSERSLMPALKLGSVAGLGVAAVVAYNRWVFAAWSLRGGYSDAFTSGALERFGAFDYLRNVWEMFLGLPNGFLVTTPILGVAAVGIYMAKDRIPRWAISATLAGVGYLLVHAALNRASGGSLVFYRYPLEAIFLMSPALAIGAVHIWEKSTRGRRIVMAAIVGSIILQFLHVFLISCWITDPVVPTCLLT